MQLIQELSDSLSEYKPQLLQILFYPNDILEKPAKPVLEFNRSIKNFLDDMVLTLQKYRALGLAANQVGADIQMLVAQDERQEPIKMVNPVIKEESDETTYESEGCLSLVGLTVKVIRSKEITVKYFNECGEVKTLVVDGLLSRVIQHEIDHLNGITMVDALGSELQRRLALEKYKKAKKKLNL